MKTGFILIAAVVLLFPYFSNAYTFSQCDFKEPYKCEAMHGLGVVIPPASYITFWFGGDTE